MQSIQYNQTVLFIVWVLVEKVDTYTYQFLELLLILTFSVVLVAHPKKLLYTVANSAPDLLNREKENKRKSLAAHHPPPPPPHPPRCSFGENN